MAENEGWNPFKELEEISSQAQNIADEFSASMQKKSDRVTAGIKQVEEGLTRRINGLVTRMSKSKVGQQIDGWFRKIQKNRR